mgnify:CR=1 FL=1
MTPVPTVPAGGAYRCDMTDDRATARILVVDDDPQVRRSLERGLRLAGFDVVAAAGGTAMWAGLALAASRA